MRVIFDRRYLDHGATSRRLARTGADSEKDAQQASNGALMQALAQAQTATSDFVVWLHEHAKSKTGPFRYRQG